MVLDILAAVLALLTVLSGLLLFLQKRLLHSVILLALTASASAFIFLYLDQVLVALLQLLVFVGGLSTYLIVAIATEEKGVKMQHVVAFLLTSVVLSAGLYAAISGFASGSFVGSDFSAVAEGSVAAYFPFILAAVFLLFAAAIGSVVVIKRFSKLVA